MLINTPASLPPSSRFQLTPNLQICRILNGMWQVSGAHGAFDPEKAVESMFTYLDAGVTTWDLADHYGPAEDFIGEFRRRLADRRGPDALAGIQAFTKWVPNPGPMDRSWVDENINKSLRRMDVDSLDLSANNMIVSINFSALPRFNALYACSARLAPINRNA